MSAGHRASDRSQVRWLVALALLLALLVLLGAPAWPAWTRGGGDVDVQAREASSPPRYAAGSAIESPHDRPDERLEARHP